MSATWNDHILASVQNVYQIPAAIFDLQGNVVREAEIFKGGSKPSWYYNMAREWVKANCDAAVPLCDVDDVGYTWASFPITDNGQNLYLIIGPLYVQSFHVRFNDSQTPEDPAADGIFLPPTYRWDIFRKLLETTSYQLYGQALNMRSVKQQNSDNVDDYISYSEYMSTHSEVVEQRRCGLRLMQFAMNCIETGNAEDLYMVISDSAFSDFTALLIEPIKEGVFDFFAYVAALSAAAAIRGGISDLEAAEAYGKHMKIIRKTDSVKQVIQCVIKMWLDFVYMVRQQECTLGHSPLVHRVLGYITKHIDEAINITDMAVAIGVSPGYLMRNFKKETKKTVNEYVREEKLKRACIYLKFFDYSIVDISERLAFCSQSHFAGCFKAIYGVTPGEYRKKTNNVPLGQS
ncbi:MAG: AraC family transcriptional regulator [Oscillospiraceae bacterium]